MKRQSLRRLVVSGLSQQATQGILTVGVRQVRCVLGRTGRRTRKCEGDGATPIGRWAMRRVLYRADHLTRPSTGLPLRPIAPLDGWCDAPDDPNYNRPVKHPYRASAEHLWRPDALYDVVIVLGHNDRVRRRGGGSAIFVHVSRPDRSPTAGCVALPRHELVRLLRRLSRTTEIIVRP